MLQNAPEMVQDALRYFKIAQTPERAKRAEVRSEQHSQTHSYVLEAPKFQEKAIIA